MKGAAIERGLQPLIAAEAAGEAVDGAIVKRGRSAQIADLDAPKIAVYLGGMLRKDA